jgi:hypothetical protein
MNSCDFTLIQGGKSDNTVSVPFSIDTDFIVIILIIIVLMVGFHD